MKNRFVAILCATASIYIMATAYASAANVTVTNGQTLTTPQTIGAGETGTVEAGGTIATTGDDEWGFLANGDGATLINNGTISTAGDFSFAATPSAFFITGDDVTATNNGTITTTGADGIAIITSSNGGTSIVNNGSVTTSGNGGTGIQSGMTGGSIINNGTIVTNGNNARGASLSDTGSTFTNNGSITTNGTGSSFAMEVSGDTNLTIINNGTLTTTGSNMNGVFFNSGNGGTTFTNNGTITATGVGISSESDNMTIVHNGRINAGAAQAISVNANNNTVVVGGNSSTDGTIAFSGTGNALRYDFTHVGGSVTTLPTVTGTHTTTTILRAGAQSAQSGNTVVVVTPEQFAGTQQVVNQTLTDAGTVLNNRQQLALLGDTTEVAEGRQYAAATTSMNDAASPNEWAIRDRTVAWAEGFGSYQERGSHEEAAESTARSGGVLAGVDLPQTGNGIRAGLYAGGFAGNLQVGEVTFREVDSAGGMAGGYVGRSFSEYYVSLGLGLGFSNNESSRFTGVDTANADYTSYFASPSLTVMRPFKGEGLTWVPSATVRYTAQYDDSYTESGSALANQTVDARTTHSLDGRAMMEARFDPREVDGGVLKPSLRAGVQGQTLIGNNDVDVQVLGSNLSFDPQGGDGTVDAVLGTNFSYAIGRELDLYFDGEANFGLNHGGPDSNKGIVGRLGARWKM